MVPERPARELGNRAPDSLQLVTPPASGGAWAMAAFGVPLAFYIATASGHGYWLDGGEFVAASESLGIAHPPGQPLAAIVGKAFCMLPFGPLAFRVALASAVAAAFASMFFMRALEH